MFTGYIKQKPLQSFLIMMGVVLLIQSYNPLAFLTNLLNIVDSYLRLILTSWPAIVLILGLVVLSKDPEGVRRFLRKLIGGSGN